MSYLATDSIQGIIAPRDIPPTPPKVIEVKTAGFVRTVEVVRSNANRNDDNWVIESFSGHSAIFKPQAE